MERLQLEGVEIIFKNFRGAEGTYNAEGARGFSVLIDNLEKAQELLAEGWALKPLKNEDGDIEAYHLPVKVNYGGKFPPRIYKITPSTKKKLSLEEPTVGMLDYVPIEYVDLVVNPYQWEVRGETGVKAYLQSLFAMIHEDELDIKWAEFEERLPDIED